MILTTANLVHLTSDEIVTLEMTVVPSMHGEHATRLEADFGGESGMYHVQVFTNPEAEWAAVYSYGGLVGAFRCTTTSDLIAVLSVAVAIVNDVIGEL